MIFVPASAYSCTGSASCKVLVVLTERSPGAEMMFHRHREDDETPPREESGHGQREAGRARWGYVAAVDSVYPGQHDPRVW